MFMWFMHGFESIPHFMRHIAVVNMVVLIFFRLWDLTLDISVQIAVLKYALYLFMPIGPIDIVQRFVCPCTSLILIGQNMINGYPLLGWLPPYPKTSRYGWIFPNRAIQINKNIRWYRWVVQWLFLCSQSSTGSITS